VSDRTEYPLIIHINGRELSRVVIDQHYAEKHSDTVDDQTILDLVKTLDGEVFLIESERDDFQYFTAEPVFKDDAPYRVIMVLYVHDDYLGVINAFRVDRS
jgi:hypothetical protein